MKKIILIVSISSCFIFQSLAQAVLIENTDGITVTQIRNNGTALMWVKDANLATTESPGAPPVNGLMQYDVALAWIAYLNSIAYAGYSDWRLPLTNPEGLDDCGYNFSGVNSEMGYLFYIELGNKGYCDTEDNCPQPGWGLTSTGPFQNIQEELYWSEEATLNQAWYFRFDSGEQCFRPKIYLSCAWAVRDTGLPSIQPGDINRDYAITIEDAIITMQVLSGLTSSSVEASDDVDVDGDSAIGLAEALYALRIISGL